MTAKLHGRLGAADLAATTNIAVYTVPAGRKATISIGLCNRAASEIAIRVAVVPAGGVGGLAAADYKYYDLGIPARGGFDRDRIPMAAGAAVVAYAQATGVSVQVEGIEEDI